MTKHAAMAWTVACALLFSWFLVYASESYIHAEQNPTVYHYVNKVCPAPSFAGR